MAISKKNKHLQKRKSFDEHIENMPYNQMVSEYWRMLNELANFIDWSAVQNANIDIPFPRSLEEYHEVQNNMRLMFCCSYAGIDETIEQLFHKYCDVGQFFMDFIKEYITPSIAYDSTENSHYYLNKNLPELQRNKKAIGFTDGEYYYLSSDDIFQAFHEEYEKPYGISFGLNKNFIFDKLAEKGFIKPVCAGAYEILKRDDFDYESKGFIRIHRSHFNSHKILSVIKEPLEYNADNEM